MTRDKSGRFVKGHGIRPIWLYTDEIRQKISTSLKNSVPWNKGKTKIDFPQMGNSGAKPGHHNRLGTKQSSESRRKMRLAKLGKTGKRCNAYKNGFSESNKRWWSRDEFKQWRRKIFERDNYTCQHCLKHGVVLNAHHLKSFEKYPSLRFLPVNGITFCTDCHYLFHKVFGFRDFTLNQSLKFINNLKVYKEMNF